MSTSKRTTFSLAFLSLHRAATISNQLPNIQRLQAAVAASGSARRFSDLISALDWENHLITRQVAA